MSAPTISQTNTTAPSEARSTRTSAEDKTQINKNLFTAAANGDIETLKALIAAGANVNYADASQTTALMQAAEKGRTEIVQTLITAGANVNDSNHQGFTALILAAGRGHAEIAQALIAAGANVNLADQGRGTALYHAAIRGHTEIVQILIAARANVALADQRGGTALHYAAANNHTEIVQALIAAGAPIDRSLIVNPETAKREGKSKELCDTIFLATVAKVRPEIKDEDWRTLFPVSKEAGKAKEKRVSQFFTLKNKLSEAELTLVKQLVVITNLLHHPEKLCSIISTPETYSDHHPAFSFLSAEENARALSKIKTLSLEELELADVAPPSASAPTAAGFAHSNPKKRDRDEHASFGRETTERRVAAYSKEEEESIVDDSFDADFFSETKDEIEEREARAAETEKPSTKPKKTKASAAASRRKKGGGRD